MASILLVENNKELEKLYNLNFRVYLGLDPLPTSGLEAAFDQILKENNKIKLIVTKAEIEGQKVAQTLYEKMKNENLKIPLLVIGETEKEIESDSLTLSMSVGVDLKTLIRNCAQVANITAAEMVGLDVPNYFPIPSHYLGNIKSPICRTFFLEPGADNEEEYQTLFSPGDEITDEKLKNYISMGVQEVFIQKNDRLKLVNQISNEMISELSFEKLNANERAVAGEVQVNTVHDKFREMGITKETVNSAKKAMRDIAKDVKKNKTLKSMLKNLLSNKASYLYKHIQVLSYVSLHLIKHADWAKKEHEEKLMFACFFHDILLKNDEQAKICTKDEFDKADLTYEGKETLKHHALRASELARVFPKAPAGVDLLIRQHHGALNGVGFPDNFSPNLSPLSLNFMVAEAYTDKVIEAGDGKIHKPLIFSYLNRRFPTNRFKKIIDALDKIIL